MAQLEIKKMKQGMSYSCKEKTIILNVFKYFRVQFPDKCVTEIVRRTAKATGCSEKSIFQFRKEEASAEGFKEPSKTKIRKNININSRSIKYDNSVRQSIRCIIYDLKYRGIVPSLNTILKQVNADAGLPNFSLMTLRRLLFDMGFYYEKNGNKSVLVDKATLNPPQPPQQINKKPQLETTKPDALPPPQQPLQQQLPQLTQNLPLTPHHPQHQMQQQPQQHHQELLHGQQRLIPMHMMQRDDHLVAQQQQQQQPSQPPLTSAAPMLNMHNGQMFTGMRRDFVPSHHGQGLHHMPPPSLPPNNVDMQGKIDMSPWMHPIVQHT